jgi:hypothetical protein
MNETKPGFSREAFRRIVRTLGLFLNSSVGGKAKCDPDKPEP